MTIPYTDIRRILDIRLKQIHDDALEYEDANLEYRKIMEMKKSIGEILISQRKPFTDSPCVGEAELKKTKG